MRQRKPTGTANAVEEMTGLQILSSLSQGAFGLVKPKKNRRDKTRAAAAPVAMDARMLRSREALRTGLLELLQRKSLEQITIRDIVARADIGYATFFRHHPTKESLLRDLAADQIDGLVNMALPALDAVDSRAACLALCAYVHERRALWSTLLTGGAAGPVRHA